MDDDPLICYGEMGVFMCLFGVAYDTPPTPPEEGYRPLLASVVSVLIHSTLAPCLHAPLHLVIRPGGYALGNAHVPLSGNRLHDTGLGPPPRMRPYLYAPYPSDARDSSFRPSYHLIVTIGPCRTDGFGQHVLTKHTG
ncbi:uncharacterized protein UHOD_11453 [Ustilago sp. UG-2017b]|nr:uncharacterized protein UHOD_11453 [Ustilago sp. UG-2017b]